MAVMFDRRADWYAESKPRAVNRDMDVIAICDHQYRQLERIHMAHWRDDSKVLLDALTKANEDRMAIRVIAAGDADLRRAAARHRPQPSSASGFAQMARSSGIPAPLH